MEVFQNDRESKRQYCLYRKEAYYGLCPCSNDTVQQRAARHTDKGKGQVYKQGSRCGRNSEKQVCPEHEGRQYQNRHRNARKREKRKNECFNNRNYIEKMTSLMSIRIHICLEEFENKYFDFLFLFLLILIAYKYMQLN